MNLRTYLMLKRAAYYNADELEGHDTGYLAKLQADSNNKFSPEAQAILDREKNRIDEYNSKRTEPGTSLVKYEPNLPAPISDKKNDLYKNLLMGGGATAGGAAGAGLGYAGSSWLAKKLGLKGRTALVAKLLGTAGLGAAGAYGGYRLGDYAGKKYL